MSCRVAMVMPQNPLATRLTSVARDPGAFGPGGVGLEQFPFSRLSHIYMHLSIYILYIRQGTKVLRCHHFALTMNIQKMSWHLGNLLVFQDSDSCTYDHLEPINFFLVRLTWYEHGTHCDLLKNQKSHFLVYNCDFTAWHHGNMIKNASKVLVDARDFGHHHFRTVICSEFRRSHKSEMLTVSPFYGLCTVY